MSDPDRAETLESAGSPDDLTKVLKDALREARACGNIRYAVDSKDKCFTENRSIVQFRIAPDLYDRFFNARTGYRAQFWIDPETGQAFNDELVEAFTAVLREGLPDPVVVRKIEVTPGSDPRDEKDAGSMAIPRDDFLASLQPHASKIWICERLYAPGGAVNGGIQQIAAGELIRALDLDIPRWAGTEGCRAPCPLEDNSWLDVKGGFRGADGGTGQIKPQDRRAKQLHETGWT